MKVNGLIIEELNEHGKLKSFVLNKDYDIGDLWIAFADEYDEPRDGTFHFMDDSYEKLFSTIYSGKKMRKVSSNKLKNIKNNQYDFSTNWDNIPVLESYELYYYSLYLPKYAYPEVVNFELAIKDTEDNDLIKVIKDKDRYIIYIKCKGSSNQHHKEPQTLNVNVIYKIDENIFINKEIPDIKNFWNDNSKLSNQTFMQNNNLMETNQYIKFEKLLTMTKDNPELEKMKLSQIKINKKKILFAVANSLDSTRLRLDEEYREIMHSLQLTGGAEHFDIKISPATRPNDLRRELLKYQPQFIHFSGHGNTEAIALENNIGNTKLVSTQAITELLALCKDNIQCVVLNSCYSEEQAQAISKHIDFVVGMNESILDRAAIEFAIGFYDAIGSGRDIEDAFNFGKNAININNIEGKEIPQLIQK